jgi:hypothetical protein
VDKELIASLTRISQRLKAEGLEREATWIARCIAVQIREERPRRKRGQEVTLGKINRRVRLDADRVRELMRSGE